MTTIPSHYYNIVPFIQQTLGREIPPLLLPDGSGSVPIAALARTIPLELAKQELSVGEYATEERILIPAPVQEHYKRFRPTPLERMEGLEALLGVRDVRLFCKREDASPIHSYKLNSALAQAFFANKEGVRELIGDTGPGNWGLGMAYACREFDVPAVIYMERQNYEEKTEKVRMMEALGANVVPIETPQGTIAASISVAMNHVRRNARNKLSLGCLSAYSALHNTVIGLELVEQLEEQGITPSAVVGVVGGGSSFSGIAFPLLAKHPDAQFIAVESTRVPSFTQGTYQYENPDALGIMPRAKMYTLGKTFVSSGRSASGLDYHGKNHLLSLLAHEGIVHTQAIEPAIAEPYQELFQRAEGILPAAESCYAIAAACRLAQGWDGTRKDIVFSLTGNEQLLVPWYQTLQVLEKP